MVEMVLVKKLSGVKSLTVSTLGRYNYNKLLFSCHKLKWLSSSPTSAITTNVINYHNSKQALKIDKHRIGSVQTNDQTFLLSLLRFGRVLTV